MLITEWNSHLGQSKVSKRLSKRLLTCKLLLRPSFLQTKKNKRQNAIFRHNWSIPAERPLTRNINSAAFILNRGCLTCSVFPAYSVFISTFQHLHFCFSDRLLSSSWAQQTCLLFLFLFHYMGSRNGMNRHKISSKLSNCPLHHPLSVGQRHLVDRMINLLQSIDVLQRRVVPEITKTFTGWMWDIPARPCNVPHIKDADPMSPAEEDTRLGLGW